MDLVLLPNVDADFVFGLAFSPNCNHAGLAYFDYVEDDVRLLHVWPKELEPDEANDSVLDEDDELAMEDLFSNSMTEVPDGLFKYFDFALAVDCVDQHNERFLVVRMEVADELLQNFQAMCCLVAEHRPEIPYGNSGTGPRFDSMSGAWEAADSYETRTCTTFILDFIKSVVQRPLLDEATWPVTSDGINENVQLCEHFYGGVAGEHALAQREAAEQEPHFAPCELVAAGAEPAKDWPVSYKKAQELRAVLGEQLQAM